MYDDYKIKPLHITLPKTSAYVKSYDGQTNYIYIFKDGGTCIEDGLLVKYETIWDKFSTDI